MFIDPDGRQIQMSIIDQPTVAKVGERLLDNYVVVGSMITGIFTGNPPHHIDGTPVTGSEGETAEMAVFLPVGIVKAAGEVTAEVAGAAIGDVAEGAAKGASTITENAAKGAAFEKQVGESLGGNKASQVTIQAADGTRTRVDWAQNNNGVPSLTEAKGSQTAPLTKAQSTAHPQIETSGGTVRGNKGAGIGLPAGTKIPPTKVDVVRPDDLLKTQ